MAILSPALASSSRVPFATDTSKASSAYRSATDFGAGESLPMASIVLSKYLLADGSVPKMYL